ETCGHLGCSLYLREIEGRDAGPPPSVDLAAERRNGDFVRSAIRARHIVACHDLSDGGLLVGIAEMAMAGGRGATLDPVPAGPPRNAFLFGEDQGRYVVEASDPRALIEAARAAGVPACAIGAVGGAALTLSGA